MQIYVNHNNQQLGPFSEAEVKAQVAAGTLSPQDHVWWEGQANWMPLGESPYAPAAPTRAPIAPSIPGIPAAAASTVPATSKLAIAALVCGCLSFFCSFLASIPAIILGHLALGEISRKPGLQGRGMALTGAILGYVVTGLIVAVGIFLSAMGPKVADIFKTIEAQQRAELSTNSMDQPMTNSLPTPSTAFPVAPPPSAPATNPPDSSTNSTDSSTNSAPGTNAAPMNQ